MKNKLNIFITILVTSFFVFSCASTSLVDLTTAILENETGISQNKSKALINTVSAVEKATEDISQEDQYIIGRSAGAIITSDNDIVRDSEKVTYINKICSALVINSDAPYLFNGYKVAILDSIDLNALSTPGGHIFITNAMINLSTSEDVLAAIIAHEIAHIQLEHSKKAIQSGRWTQATLSTLNTLSTLADDRNKSDLEEKFNLTVSDFVSDVVSKGYSKNQEFDADEYALNLLQRTGYSPKAMLELLELLQSKQGRKTTLDKTHPTPKDRIKKIEKLLQKEPYCSSNSNPEDRQERFNGVFGK